MNKIDVFFKFLENADKKGREVTFKDYGNVNKVVDDKESNSVRKFVTSVIM